MSPPDPLSFPAGWSRPPDPQALHETGARLEAQAHHVLARARATADALFADAHALFNAGARAGSLEAMHACARLAVADGASFRWAQQLLAEAERRFPDVPARALVSVAPDVLGPNLRLDSDGTDERDAGFTVISPYPSRAAATLDRVSPDLMGVDENGRLTVTRDDHPEPEGWDIPYTPNYVFPVTVSDYGAQVVLDTKSVLWAAMGRTMVELIAKALAEDRVPAHIAADDAISHGYFRPWQADG